MDGHSTIINYLELKHSNIYDFEKEYQRAESIESGSRSKTRIMEYWRIDIPNNGNGAIQPC